MQIATKTPVLIVGGGPFGLMLSIELGRRGVHSVLVDRKERTAVNPQANATQARTMEYYRRLGFADEIRALGLPRDYPTDIAYFTRYCGRELARFELPSSAAAGSAARDGTSGWNAAELPHRVSQKFVEEVLRRKAEELGATSVHYGVALIGFEQAESGVRATIEDVQSGVRQSIEADYLIGADGARSLVRRQLGIKYSGETGVERDFFGGKMVAVHFRSADFYRCVPHPRAWMYWAFNPERRAWCAAVNGIDEFAFHTQLKKGEAEDVGVERAKAMFAQAMGAEIQMEILSVDTWIAGHALVAVSLGGGRVYIGGDAAHLFTPAGGLGYNTAVEDAVNLGWKLAATIRGVAGPALLPSYAEERRRLAVRNTGYARQLAESIGGYVPNAGLEEDGPAGEALRRQAGAYLNDHARREFNIPGITFGGRYDGSPIVVSDGAEVPPDSLNQYVPTASPGGRLPHMWLKGGQSIYDRLGLEWALVVTGTSCARDVAAFEAEAARRGLDLAVIDLAEENARSLYGADLVLVRPDQVVAWRGNANESQPQPLFDQLTGRSEPESVSRLDTSDPATPQGLSQAESAGQEDREAHARLHLHS
jgi:2-polyprenyl-6-methoxyphenol hydroxylase-like FAD-dependent oxidoreductase